MERLTERNKDVVIMKNPKLANERLADFEDFMDKHSFESLEDIEGILTRLDLSFRTNCRLVGVNTKLKERWQKLKLSVEDELAEDKRLFRYAEDKEDKSVRADYMIVEEFVLAKMQELEEEE